MFLGDERTIGTGLRKVSDDMKTHKNPALRTTAVVPARDTPAAAATPSASSGAKVVGPPKKALDGKTWIVENFNGDKVQFIFLSSHMPRLT